MAQFTLTTYDKFGNLVDYDSSPAFDLQLIGLLLAIDVISHDFLPEQLKQMGHLFPSLPFGTISAKYIR